MDEMPVTIPTTPLSRKDIALHLLEQLKTALENDAVDDAAEQLAQLRTHIEDWQRAENLRLARDWLDNALAADLLTFDTGKARAYLEKWSAASESDETPELDDYRERVEARSKQKNEALLIRGVMSHSNEIVDQAKTLEAGAEPPAPDFMMRQYYDKARNLVLSAQAEYEKNTDLEQLVQRIERLHNNKQTAATIYPMALESQKYSNALNNLDQLPPDFIVPRYTATQDVDGKTRLQYQNMVAISAARSEITTLAQTWATQLVTNAIATSQRYLDAHEPQESVDELDLGDNIERFLPAEQKTGLEQAKSNATTQLRNREKSEERAARALELVQSDPLAAWDEYVAAHQAYEWGDGVDEARQAALKGMRSRLKAMARDADVAFHEARDMERVREISTRAKQRFADKDPSLNELLQQFDEFEEMIRSYQEYIAAGNEILAKVKQIIWDDAVAANDLLSQIETYPDFVLQAFDELYSLRQQVNQRLNADQTYNQLYTALFADVLPDITQAIERTNVAAGEFPNDDRFPILEKWLKYHMAFVSAVPQFERGAYEQVVQLIAPVLNHTQHPDYEAANKMSQAIQATRQQAQDSDVDDRADEDVSDE